MRRFIHALCIATMCLLVTACSQERFAEWKNDMLMSFQSLKPMPQYQAIQKNGGQVMIRGYEHRVLLSISTIFEVNSAHFLPGAAAQLQEVVGYLQLCPHSDVVVAAYGPPIHGREIEKRLAIARARAVVSYLWSHGVSDARLHAFGVGHKDPIAHNNRLRGFELNRRIEITF